MKVALKLALCLWAVTLSQGRPQAPAAEYGPPKAEYGVPGAGGGGGGYPSGGPGGAGGGGGGGDEGPMEPANYSFMYEVKDGPSGNDFGHMEARMGDVAMGSYNVQLPDGRMQKVDYVADKGGYKPTVTYTGEAKYGPGVGGGSTGGGGGGGGGTGGDGGGYRYKR